MDCRSSIRISEEDFDVGAELEALYGRSDGSLGAVASFIGLVRDRFDSNEVQTLQLEHYPGMTEKSIERFVREAAGRWPLQDVVVVHRVGRLEPQAQIVYVQVASAHRAAAFAGAEFIMDYLKTDAVFWKRETHPEQDRWVEATDDDRRRRQSWTAGDPAGTE